MAFSAFLAFTQLISGTTNTNSLQAGDKPASKAMQTIDNHLGRLRIHIIIERSFPIREESSFTRSQNGNLGVELIILFKRKTKQNHKQRGIFCLVLKRKAK